MKKNIMNEIDFIDLDRLPKHWHNEYLECHHDEQIVPTLTAVKKEVWERNNKLSKYKIFQMLLTDNKMPLNQVIVVEDIRTFFGETLSLDDGTKIVGVNKFRYSPKCGKGVVITCYTLRNRFVNVQLTNLKLGHTFISLVSLINNFMKRRNQVI